MQQIDVNNLMLIIKSSVKYLELITAIIGAIYYYKYKNSSLKWFLFLLFYIAFNDFLGLFMRVYLGIKHNAILYNIMYIINFTILYYVYKTHIKNNTSKKVITYFLYLYLLSVIINGFYVNYLMKAQSIPFIIGSLFLIISIIIYFVEILNSEEILFIKKNLLFYISVGLLLYYTSSIPFRIVQDYYTTNFNILYGIKFCFVIIMNLFFIYGFIWSKEIT